MKYPFFLFIVLLVYSCSKDDNEILDLNEEVSFRSIDISNLILIDNYEWFSPLVPKSPPPELLDSIKSRMYSKQNWVEVDSIISTTYGEISWRHSIIDILDHSNYIVTVPVLNNKSLTAIIRYHNDGDHNHFAINSYWQIKEQTSNFSSVNVSDEVFIDISRTFYFQNIISHNVDPDLNQWLLDYIDANQDKIVPRSTTLFYSVSFYERITYIDENGTEWAGLTIGSRRMSARVPCVDPTIVTIEPPEGPQTSGGDNDGIEPPEDSTNNNLPDDKDCYDNNYTIELISFLQNYNINIPCNEVDSSSDIIEYLNSLCDDVAEQADNTSLGIQGEFNPSLSDLFEKLESVDYIVESPKFVDCEAYKCVSDYLTESSNSQYCELMSVLFDSDEFTINYTTHDIGTDAWTQVTDLENKIITISVHSVDCDKDDKLFIAETLLHEGQHAVWNAEIADQVDNWTTEEKIEAWAIYASQNFGISYSSQHEAMFYEYMTMAAEFLWNLNGNQLTPGHYMQYVWEPLAGIGINPPQDSLDTWEDRYDELNGNDPYTTNYNTFDCP